MKSLKSKTRTRIQRRYSTIWEIADEMWTQIARLLPASKPAGTVGRPALSNWQVYQGVVYVLRTGCQWKSLKTTWFGAASSTMLTFKPGAEAVYGMRCSNRCLRFTIIINAFSGDGRRWTPRACLRRWADRRPVRTLPIAANMAPNAICSLTNGVRPWP